MKIKFNSDDELPLNKVIEIPSMIIVVRAVFYQNKTSQGRRRYVSNDTANEVSVEHRQDVLVVRLHVTLLVCRDNVSCGRNDNVLLVRLHDVSNKSQMKYPMTSQWYVSTTSH